MVVLLLCQAITIWAHTTSVPVKLPEPLRTSVIMALLGIVLVGLLLIVGTMLGGHWVRRLGDYRRGPAVPNDQFLHLEKKKRNERGSSQSLPESQSIKDTIATDDTMTS